MTEAKKTFFDISKLRRIFHYAAPYRKKFYLSVALAILLALITPLRPLLIQLTVDKYIAHSIPRMVVAITLIQGIIILIETAMRFLFFYHRLAGAGRGKRYTRWCL